MILFIDTEFNGFGGALLSLALVPADPSVPEFYRELEVRDQLHPWVRENVIPHMCLVPSTRLQFQMALADYLRKFDKCVIVADWPDDIRYFCESLITGPGEMINCTPVIRFELDLGIQYTSEVPHHALHDARAIRNAYVNRERS